MIAPAMDTTPVITIPVNCVNSNPRKVFGTVSKILRPISSIKGLTKVILAPKNDYKTTYEF